MTATHAVNTTFVVARPLAGRFLGHLRAEYLEAARLSGIFGRPTLSRVLSSPEPDSECYALLMPACSLEAARNWLATKGATIIGALQQPDPSALLTFTTEMVLLPL